MSDYYTEEDVRAVGLAIDSSAPLHGMDDERITYAAGVILDAVAPAIVARAKAEQKALRSRLDALIDRWDGEVGAQEDHQHAAAVRAVEACLSDLRGALAEHDHPGCCTCCDGAGYDNGCMGMCWDCRGTGHPHPLDGAS